ncbi:hypothetical protein [Marixanthomonas spongiae]|uniref:Uncharacterized protein n=1 Tax=Marixanthomonas spongiae TaxID=2174845 RepID=A0A2U0I0D9_9FLAO|nr:hypothetical protein [Marixanthomonas spongiae]PVW14568.1 hypothetical protein DDV96_08540 [Marixanthomonas spongiae]
MEDNEHENPFKFEEMPIYKKAMEISKLADKVVELVRDKQTELPEGAEGEMIQDYGHYIRLNAMTIPAKIAGAEGGDLYDLRMENAAIIRKAAREIKVDCTGLKMCGFKDEDYLELLRNEIDEFRPLFAEWVKSFDQWNYIIDRWGLFNPSGVNYDDEDPDDDIPFNPDDFFDEDL